jgi:hypothetical protein
VSAAAARLHLQHLAVLGIGIRQVSRMTGVAASVVRAVRNGRTETLRASTSARLLATPPQPAPGALVAATRSWRCIDSLEREGYTRRELAARLGLHSQQLQLAPRRIRASTASRLHQLYTRLALT